MRKPDFTLVWKILLSCGLTAVLELAVIDISQLRPELRWVYLFTGIIFAIASLAIVQVTWVGIDKWIRKNRNRIKEYLYRPAFEYYFKTDNDKFLNLYIKSHPKNKKAYLTVELSRMKFISAADNFKETRDIGISNIRDKRLYDKDIESGDTRLVLLSQKSVEGKDMLSVPFDRFGVSLEAGKYFYEFYEYGTHKGVTFDRNTIKKEFVYNDKGEFEL